MIMPRFRLAMILCCVLVGTAPLKALAARQGNEAGKAPPASEPAALAPNWIGLPAGGGLLSWMERGTGKAVRLRYRTTGPTGFGPPASALEFDDGFVNWADVPALAPFKGEGAGKGDGAGPHYLAARLRMLGEGTYAYGISTAHSQDGGVTWGKPRWLHSDRSESEHGFVTLLPRPSGGLRAFWLDGRGTLAGGPMTLRTRALSPAGEWGPEEELDGRTCDCCPTRAVNLKAGRVLVAWRDRSADEVRDMAYALGTPTESGALKWSMPRTLHDDGWKIAGCPVNGPALAAPAAGQTGPLAAAWFTMGRNARPRVLLALSTNEGESFSAPLTIDGGDPLGRVDLAYAPNGGLAIVWLEKGEQGAQWRLRLLEPSGELSAPRTVAEVPAERSSGFARLVPVGGDLSLVWTRTGRGLGIAELDLSE